MGLRGAIRGVERLGEALDGVLERQRQVQAAFDKTAFPAPGAGGTAALPASPGLRPLTGSPRPAGPPVGGGGGGAAGGGEGSAARGVTGISDEERFANLAAMGCWEAEIELPHPRAHLRGAGATIKVKGMQCPFERDGVSFFPYPGQLQPATPSLSGRSGGGAGGASGGGGGAGFDPGFVPSPGGGGDNSITRRLAGRNPTQFLGGDQGAPDTEAPDDGGKSLTAGDKAIVGELRRLNNNLRQSPADRRAASEGLY